MRESFLHSKATPPADPLPVPAVSPVPLVDLVLDSLASPHSRRTYHRALGEFFAWYPSNASGEGFTRATLQRYRSHLIERGLSAASVNLSLAALRKLAAEAAAHGGLSPLAAAGIRGVPGARRSGVRTGNWLTLQQAQQLLAAPDPGTRKGLKVHRLKAMGLGDTNTLSRLKPTFAAAQTASFRRRSFGGSGPFGTS